MKTLFTILFATLATVQLHAQNRSRHDELSKGLELVGSGRHDYSQYQNLNRLNYWSSRFDRYWSKYEKVFSADFAERISRSTRNVTRHCNNWASDRYTTRNRTDIKRKEGLIKIN